MNSKNKKTIRLLQYILATAGQNDQHERELGQIHLIKYVYLADLNYAKYHNGESFTGLEWRFHHFGPWSVECFKMIEPALEAIEARQRVIESQSYKDFVRWSISDDSLFDRLGKTLDLNVMGTVQKYVRKFSADTNDLLDFVYKTEPMINAAPGEILHFRALVPKTNLENNLKNEPITRMTERQKKKRRQKLLEFKNRLNARLEEKVKVGKSNLCPLPPRYDDIFYQGVSELNKAAGMYPEEGDYLASFSENIWKSKVRHDPEVS